MSKALFKSRNASVGQMSNDSLVVFGCFTTLEPLVTIVVRLRINNMRLCRWAIA